MLVEPPSARRARARSSGVASPARSSRASRRRAPSNGLDAQKFSSATVRRSPRSGSASAPVEGRTQVRLLRENEVAPLLPTGILGEIRRLGERQEVLCMAPPELVCLARLGEPLGGILADRLEHRVALALEAQEALVDERRELVQVGRADGLRGVDDPAAVEDGQPGEQLPLVEVRRSWLEAIASRSVRWRAGASRLPPVRSGRRCSRRSRICRGESDLTRRPRARARAVGRPASRRSPRRRRPPRTPGGRRAPWRERTRRPPRARTVRPDTPAPRRSAAARGS